MTLRTPTTDEMGAAVRNGSPIYFSKPAHVPMGLDAFAALNLAAAVRGETDPWTVTYSANGIVDIATSFDRSVYVNSMEIEQVGIYDAAVRAAPQHSDRHDGTANQARADAGRIVMRIEDVMIRARLLDALDAWVGAVGELIDNDPAEGELYVAPGGVDARVLVVTCPSTGRRYAHRVPPEFNIAKAARAWMMQGATPEVET